MEVVFRGEVSGEEHPKTGHRGEDGADLVEPNCVAMQAEEP
jgi:hypothetical protein